MQKLFGLLDRLFKYLIAALLIIIPLYPKFPFVRIPGIYVSIRLEDFLLATIFVAALIRIIPRIRSFLKDEIVQVIFIFLTVGLVSLVSGVFLTKTVQPALGTLHFLRRVEYLVPLFAVFAFFPFEKAKNLEFYIKTLMIVIFVAFLYGFGQRYLNFPVIITQNQEYSKGVALRWMPGSHISSTFAGHYDLATFLVLTLPIFISSIFIYKDKLTKGFLLIIILSGFWLLVNSVSRISIVSYLLGSSLSLFLIKKYKVIPIFIILSILASGLSSSLFARYQRVIEVLYNKLTFVNFEVLADEVTLSPASDEVRPAATPGPLVFEDRSTSIRLNVEWPRAIRAFSKNPLLGTGYSSIGLASDNDYLRLLGEIGALGFLAFMLIVTRIAGVFRKVLPLDKNFSAIESGYMAGIIGGTFGILLNAVFIDIFEASKFATIFWLLIAFGVYLVKDKLNEQKI